MKGGILEGGHRRRGRREGWGDWHRERGILKWKRGDGWNAAGWNPVVDAFRWQDGQAAPWDHPARHWPVFRSAVHPDSTVDFSGFSHTLR